MGLDTVELIINIENQFSIKIPDIESEKMITVGDLSDWVFAAIKIKQQKQSIKQKVYLQLCKILADFGHSSDINPESITATVLPSTNLAANWRLLEKKLQLQLPQLSKQDFNKKLDKDVQLLGLKLYERAFSITQTSIQKLIDSIISLNHKELINPQQISEKYEVERIIIALTHNSTGIPFHQIELHHTFTDDLGLD